MIRPHTPYYATDTVSQSLQFVGPAFNIIFMKADYTIGSFPVNQNTLPGVRIYNIN